MIHRWYYGLVTFLMSRAAELWNAYALVVKAGVDCLCLCAHGT
jgi:hypothetical protein